MLISSISYLFIQNISASTVDSLKQLLNKEQLVADRYETYSSIADHFLFSGGLDSHRVYATKMLELGIFSKQDTLVGRAYINLSLNFKQQKDYKHNLEYLIKALDILSSHPSQYGTCNNLKEIGDTYKELKNYNLAISYLYRALEVVPVSQNNTMRNRIYSHLSEAYLGLNKLDSSLFYVQLANVNTYKEKDFYGYARVLNIFGKVHEAMGELKVAESYYKTCIAFASQNNIHSSNVNANLLYAKLLLKQGDIIQAKKFTKNHFNFSYITENLEDRMDASNLLKDIYRTIGDRDSAYYYAKLFSHLSDTLQQANENFTTQNLAYSKHLDLLEKEIENNKIKNQNLLNLEYIFIFIGLFSLFILFLALSNTIIVTPGFIKVSGFFIIVLFFEFINLTLHYKLTNLSHQYPLVMLIIMVLVALLIIPIHHRLEKWLINKLSQKNQDIHYQKAKNTLEEITPS